MRDLFQADELEAAGADTPTPDPGYTYPEDPQVAANLEHWQDQKLGVVIHWGIYSGIGQSGSWSLHRERLGDFTDAPSRFTGSASEYHTWYQDQARNFGGDDFEAAEWASACADAGMRYVIMTAKHHDGFCMYDSKFTNFKSTSEDSGLGRDAFGEVVDAFRAEGLETGVYFSKADWSRPEYWDRGQPISNRYANYSVVDHPRRWQRFVEFTHDQIAELLSNYGPMNVLWLDAGWVREPREPIDIDGIAVLARELQPGILVVDREVHGPHENYRTPEQRIPDAPLGMPWEACLTLTRGWCSMRRDDLTKPTHEMIETLLKVVSRGGNLLLGIGPDATGHLSRHVRTSLSEIGDWMRAYGHAIYGTRALTEPPQQITATSGGITLPQYALRLPDGDTALFFATGELPAGAELEIRGLPASATGLAGEQLRQSSHGVLMIAPQRFAVGVRLPATENSAPGQADAA